MALPEILIVLSSITVQDTLPKRAVVPVANIEKKADSVAKKTSPTVKPISDKAKEKVEAIRKIKRSGWDHN